MLGLFKYKNLNEEEYSDFRLNYFGPVIFPRKITEIYWVGEMVGETQSNLVKNSQVLENRNKKGAKTFRFCANLCTQPGSNR